MALLLPLLAVILSGCASQVSGYQSPIAHDYAPLAWLPLDRAVAQPFVAGTGYSAAIGNDMLTTPTQLQARLAALPNDTRGGSLRELRAGVRLRNDTGAAWQTGARLELVYSPELDARWSERDFRAWPDNEVWLPEIAGDRVVTQSFASPYPMLAGLTLRVATFGADFTPGPATVGPNRTELLALPIDGERVGTLEAGQVVQALSALEGWARVRLADGVIGFAPQAAFASLPPPARVVGGDLRLALRDAVTGALLREAIVPAAALRDNSHLDVRFAPLPDALGRRYTFELALPDARPGAGVTFRAATATLVEPGLIMRPLYASAPPLLNVAMDELPRVGDWVRVDEPPSIAPGTVVTLRLLPGSRPDAPRLEFGLTPDRVPFGGWTSQGAGRTGALLVQTRYMREVVVTEALAAGFRRLRAGARGDLVFLALYTVGVAGLVAGAGWLALGARRPRGARSE